MTYERKKRLHKIENLLNQQLELSVKDLAATLDV